MLAPYRMAAPPPPDPPEEADRYESRLRARARRWQFGVVNAIALGVAAISALALLERPRPRSHHEAPYDEALSLDPARERLATARELVGAQQEQFSRAVIAALEMQPSSAPCMRSLREPSALVRTKSFPLGFAKKGDDRIASPSLARSERALARAEEYFAAGSYLAAANLASSVASNVAELRRARERFDVIVVTSKLERPLETTDTRFEPGALRGRAYVYDFAEQRVTCAGDIEAASSKQVPYAALTLAASLEEDFELQVERAIARAPLFGL